MKAQRLCSKTLYDCCYSSQLQTYEWNWRAQP